MLWKAWVFLIVTSKYFGEKKILLFPVTFFSKEIIVHYISNVNSSSDLQKTLSDPLYNDGYELLM